MGVMRFPLAEKVVRRELDYLREDAYALRVRVSDALTPHRRTAALLLAGAVAVVHGFSLWSEAVAWVVMGAVMIFSAYTLVDLDPPKPRRRRVRKKTAA